MQGYLGKGKELLKALINEGFEAYFFGETVRNTLLGLDCDEVQIMTSASVDELSQIFAMNRIAIINANTATLRIDDYQFVITSYPPQNGNSSQVKTLNSNILDNLSKANFTVNALAMSAGDKITDLYDSGKDIKKLKAIKVVGSAKQRFYDNPIFMLDAIQLISELNFTLSTVTEAGIKKRINMLSKLNVNEIGAKFKKILMGRYAKKALGIFNKLGMGKGISFLEKGLRKYIANAKEYYYDDFILVCMIVNKESNEQYLETCDNPNQVDLLYSLVSANLKAKYDRLTLFTYGKENCIKAYHISKLLGYGGSNSEKKIEKEYASLPVKKRCDLKFKGEDIMRISDLRDAEQIGDMFEDMVYQVVMGDLPNEAEALQRYACDCLREKGIYFDITRTQIKGIQPGVGVNKDGSTKNTEMMDDYQKFISGLSANKEKAKMQSEIDDPYGRDKSKFELPGEARIPSQVHPELYGVPSNNDDVVVKNEDNIDYSNYKDPKVPDYKNINSIYGDYTKSKPQINENEFPFESEFDKGEEVDPNNTTTYFYENKSTNETDERLRKLEERLNEQDRLIKEQTVALEKQKVLNVSSKLSAILVDQMLKEQVLPNYVDSNDFEKRLNDFIGQYIENANKR